ncbi:uncharacterized protein LOC130903042 isoform X3 [Diorhabda carinulata]|uniref:uncharacterized protein LOC130903042 isoform X3 n=1 Tax=Diorhabda carinulata TaxID=1163345 RepID=UPI0025A13F8F|nr:uncharacterized protein LOC130903042 isoform X3 [Diorhabda carinulata]
MTYVNKRTRAFQNPNELQITRVRSEGRMKTYQSAQDLRAWSDITEERRQYILDYQSKPRLGLHSGKIIPVEYLVESIAAFKNERIKQLEQRINYLEKILYLYSQLDLAPQQKKKLDELKKELNSAYSELTALHEDVCECTACHNFPESKRKELETAYSHWAKRTFKEDKDLNSGGTETLITCVCVACHKHSEPKHHKSSEVTMSDDNLLKTDHKIRPKSVGSKESEPDRTDLKTSSNKKRKKFEREMISTEEKTLFETEEDSRVEKTTGVTIDEDSKLMKYIPHENKVISKSKDVKKGKSEDEDMRVSIDNLHKEPPKSKKRDKSSDIEDQDQNKKRLRERDLRSQDKHTEGKIFYTSKTKDGLLDNEIYKYGVEEEQTSNGIEKKKTIKKETETSRRIGEADRDATKMKDDYGQEYRTGKKRSRVGLDKKNLKKDNVTIENKTKTQKIPLSTEELIKKGEEQPRKVKMRDDVRGKSEDLQETTETRKKILENQRIASDKKELLEQKLKTEQVPSDKDVVIDQRDKSLSKKDMFGYKRMPQGQENEEKSLKEKVKAEQVPRDKYLVDKGVTKDHRDKGDLKMIQDKIFQGEKEKRSDDEFRINDTNKKAIKKKVVDDRGMKFITEKVLEEKQKQVHEIGIITGVKDRSEEQTLTGNNTEAPKVKGVDVNYHMEQARKSKIRDDAKDKSEDLEETAERRKKILENQRITSVEKNILGKKRKTEQVQADRDVAVDQRDKVESKMEMFGNQRIPRQEEKAEKHPKEKFKAEQLQRDKHLVDKGVNKDQRDKEDLKMIVDKRPLQEKEKRLDEEFKTNDTNKGAMKKTVLEDRGIKSMGKKLLEEKPEQVHKNEIITGEKNVAEEQTLTGYKEKKDIKEKEDIKDIPKRADKADRDIIKIKNITDYGPEDETGRRKSRIGLEEKNLKKDRITIGDKAKAEKTPFSTEVPIKKGVDVKYHMELAKKEKIKDRAGEKSGGPQETEITKKKIIDTNGTTPVEKKLINKKYETVQDKDVTIDSGDNSKSKMEMFSYKRIPLEEDKEEGPLKEKLQAKQVQRDKDLVDKSKTKDERGREDTEATKKKILDTNRTTSAEKKLMNKKYETDKDVTVDAGDKAKSKIKKFSYKRIPQGTEQEEEPLKDKLIGDERFQQENDKSIDEESRTNDANKEVIKKKEVDDRRIKSAEENVLDYKHVTKKDIITGEKEVPEQYKESRKTAGDPASMLKVGKGLGKEHLAEQAKKEQLLFDQQTKYNGQIDREKKALQQNILEDKDLSPLEKNIFKGKFRENQDQRARLQPDVTDKVLESKFEGEKEGLIQIRTDGKKLISKDQEVLNDKLRKDKNRKERLEKIVLGEEAITSTEKKVIDNAREDLMLDVREQRDKDGLKRKLIGDRIQSPREEKMLGKAENEKFRKQLVEAEEPLMSAQKVALKQRTLGDEELTNTKRESDELKQKIFGGKEKISEKVKNSEEMYQAKWPQKAKLVVDEILENDKDLKQKIFDDKKFILEEGKTIEDKSKAKKVMKLPTSEQILHGSDKLSKDEPKITILNDRKLTAKEEQMLDEQLEKENAVKLRSFGEKKSLRKYEEKREDIKKSLNDYKQLIPNEEMEKTLIFGEKKMPLSEEKMLKSQLTEKIAEREELKEKMFGGRKLTPEQATILDLKLREEQAQKENAKLDKSIIAPIGKEQRKVQVNVSSDEKKKHLENKLKAPADKKELSSEEKKRSDDVLKVQQVKKHVSGKEHGEDSELLKELQEEKRKEKALSESIRRKKFGDKEHTPKGQEILDSTKIKQEENLKFSFLEKESKPQGEKALEIKLKEEKAKRDILKNTLFGNRILSPEEEKILNAKMREVQYSEDILRKELTPLEKRVSDQKMKGMSKMPSISHVQNNSANLSKMEQGAVKKNILGDSESYPSEGKLHEQKWKESFKKSLFEESSPNKGKILGEKLKREEQKDSELRGKLLTAEKERVLENQMKELTENESLKTKTFDDSLAVPEELQIQERDFNDKQALLGDKKMETFEDEEIITEEENKLKAEFEKENLKKRPFGGKELSSKENQELLDTSLNEEILFGNKEFDVNKEKLELKMKQLTGKEKEEAAMISLEEKKLLEAEGKQDHLKRDISKKQMFGDIKLFTEEEQFLEKYEEIKKRDSLNRRLFDEKMPDWNKIIEGKDTAETLEGDEIEKMDQDLEKDKLSEDKRIGLGKKELLGKIFSPEKGQIFKKKFEESPLQKEIYEQKFFGDINLTEDEKFDENINRDKDSLKKMMLGHKQLTPEEEMSENAYKKQRQIELKTHLFGNRELTPAEIKFLEEVFEREQAGKISEQEKIEELARTGSLGQSLYEGNKLFPEQLKVPILQKDALSKDLFGYGEEEGVEKVLMKKVLDNDTMKTRIFSKKQLFPGKELLEKKSEADNSLKEELKQNFVGDRKITLEKDQMQQEKLNEQVRRESLKKKLFGDKELTLEEAELLEAKLKEERLRMKPICKGVCVGSLKSINQEEICVTGKKISRYKHPEFKKTLLEKSISLNKTYAGCDTINKYDQDINMKAEKRKCSKLTKVLHERILSPNKCNAPCNTDLQLKKVPKSCGKIGTEPIIITPDKIRSKETDNFKASQKKCVAPCNNDRQFKKAPKMYGKFVEEPITGFEQLKSKDKSDPPKARSKKCNVSYNTDQHVEKLPERYEKIDTEPIIIRSDKMRQRGERDLKKTPKIKCNAPCNEDEQLKKSVRYGKMDTEPIINRCTKIRTHEICKHNKTQAKVLSYQSIDKCHTACNTDEKLEEQIFIIDSSKSEHKKCLLSKSESTFKNTQIDIDIQIGKKGKHIKMCKKMSPGYNSNAFYSQKTSPQLCKSIRLEEQKKTITTININIPLFDDVTSRVVKTSENNLEVEIEAKASKNVNKLKNTQSTCECSGKNEVHDKASVPENIIKPNVTDMIDEDHSEKALEIMKNFFSCENICPNLCSSTLSEQFQESLEYKTKSNASPLFKESCGAICIGNKLSSKQQTNLKGLEKVKKKLFKQQVNPESCEFDAIQLEEEIYFDALDKEHIQEKKELAATEKSFLLLKQLPQSKLSQEKISISQLPMVEDVDVILPNFDEITISQDTLPSVIIPKEETKSKIPGEKYRHIDVKKKESNEEKNIVIISEESRGIREAKSTNKNQSKYSQTEDLTIPVISHELDVKREYLETIKKNTGSGRQLTSKDKIMFILSEKGKENSNHKESEILEKQSSIKKSGVLNEKDSIKQIFNKQAGKIKTEEFVRDGSPIVKEEIAPENEKSVTKDSIETIQLNEDIMKAVEKKKEVDCSEILNVKVVDTKEMKGAVVDGIEETDIKDKTGEILDAENSKMFGGDKGVLELTFIKNNKCVAPCAMPTSDIIKMKRIPYNEDIPPIISTCIKIKAEVREVPEQPSFIENICTATCAWQSKQVQAHRCNEFSQCGCSISSCICLQSNKKCPLISQANIYTQTTSRGSDEFSNIHDVKPAKKLPICPCRELMHYTNKITYFSLNKYHLPFEQWSIDVQKFKDKASVVARSGFFVILPDKILNLNSLIPRGYSPQYLEPSIEETQEDENSLTSIFQTDYPGSYVLSEGLEQHFTDNSSTRSRIVSQLSSISITNISSESTPPRFSNINSRIKSEEENFRNDIILYYKFSTPSLSISIDDISKTDEETELKAKIEEIETDDDFREHISKCQRKVKDENKDGTDEEEETVKEQTFISKFSTKDKENVSTEVKAITSTGDNCQSVIAQEVAILLNDGESVQTDLDTDMYINNIQYLVQNIDKIKLTQLKNDNVLKITRDQPNATDVSTNIFKIKRSTCEMQVGNKKARDDKESIKSKGIVEGMETYNCKNIYNQIKGDEKVQQKSSETDKAQHSKQYQLMKKKEERCNFGKIGRKSCRRRGSLNNGNKKQNIKKRRINIKSQSKQEMGRLILNCTTIGSKENLYASVIPKDTEIIALRNNLVAEESYGRGQENMTSAMISHLNSKKEVAEKQDDSKNQQELRESYEEQKLCYVEAASKDDAEKAAPSNLPQNLEILLMDNEIKQLDQNIKQMRNQDITPELRVRIIRKEVEVMKKYCSQLSIIQRENDKLKEQIFFYEDSFSKLGCFPVSPKLIEELKLKIEATNEEKQLREKVRNLEKELCLYTYSLKDVEVLRQRSLLLEEVLTDRERLSQKVEQLGILDQEIHNLKKKAAIVDELENCVLKMRREKNFLEIELNQLKRKLSIVEGEEFNRKAEREILESKIVCMEQKITNLKSLCEDKERLRVERDHLKYSLEEMIRKLEDVEKMRKQIQCLEALKAERDIFKSKYETLIGLEHECDLLRDQLDRTKYVEIERNSLEIRLEDLEACLEDQENEKKRLVHYINTLSKARDEEQEKFNKYANQMRVEIEKKDSLITSTQEKLSFLVTRLEDSVNDLNSQTLEHKSKTSNLESDINTLTLKLNNLKAKNEKLVDCLSNIENENQRLIQHIMDLKKENDNLIKNLKNLKETNIFLKKTLEEKEDSLNSTSEA